MLQVAEHHIHALRLPRHFREEVPRPAAPALPVVDVPARGKRELCLLRDLVREVAGVVLVEDDDAVERPEPPR